MKKVLTFGLASLTALCLTVSPAFACGEKTDGAKAQLTSSGSCGSKTTATTAAAHENHDAKAQMVGANGSCGSKEATAKTASADKAACTAHGAKLTAEECAKMMNMSAEECAKMCGYTGKMEMVNMSIKGMTCGGCEKSVTTALEKVDGVVKVISVNYTDGSALVCIDPSKTKAENVTTAVSNKGYEVEVIPAVATTTTSASGKTCSAAEKAACASHKEAKVQTTGAEGSK